MASFLISTPKWEAPAVLMGLNELDALACGENGCLKDYRKITVHEVNGKVGLFCEFCGSLKCEEPR